MIPHSSDRPRISRGEEAPESGDLRHIPVYRQCLFAAKTGTLEKEEKKHTHKARKEEFVFSEREGEGRFAMAAVAVLRNETLQAFLQVCAQLCSLWLLHSLGNSLVPFV